MHRDYAYDPIGNRVTSAEGTGSPWSYARNSLNQYPAVDMPELGGRYKFDPDGNLTEVLASADINLDGNIDQDDVDMVLFCYGMNVDDPNCGMSLEERQRADISGNGVIDQDDLDAVLFSFGTTVSDTLNALLTWDGENRLVEWRPRSPKSGSKKCEFKYDYLGRRVEKKVYTYSGSAWSLTTTRRFVWREWLRMMELDGSGNVLRKWTWGRDLSGTLDGAGGIGGLLSVHDANETPGDPNDDMKYVYFFDANGNVGQVVNLAVGDPNNTIKAKYEYDAYGNVTSSGGAYAAANVVRFSTKPWDDETGMGDWGRRYYDPRLGRWIGHDPIGEQGGLNLYAYVFNSPIVGVDALGRCTQAATQPSVPDCTGETCNNYCKDPRAGGMVLCEKHNDGCVPCTCVCPEAGDRIIDVLPDGKGNNSPGRKRAADIIKRCIKAQEEHHAKTDVTCSPPDKNGNCTPSPNSKPGFTECGGEIATLECLKRLIGECGGDKDCVAFVKKAAQRSSRYCELFGSQEMKNNPNAPPSYKNACPEADRKGAITEFR